MDYCFPPWFVQELIQQTFQLFLRTAGNTSLLPAPHLKGSSSSSGQPGPLQLCLGHAQVCLHLRETTKAARPPPATQTWLGSAQWHKSPAWLRSSSDFARLPSRRNFQANEPQNVLPERPATLRASCCIFPWPHQWGQTQWRSAFKLIEHDGAVLVRSPPALSPAWVTDAMTPER